jgi:uncharacterized membrane protein YbhN (UPF0104 family)
MTIAERVRALASGERKHPTSPWALVAAMVLFVGSGVFAFRELPSIDAAPEWWILVLTGIGVPTIAVLNSLEYHLMGKLVDHKVGAWDAMRVTVVASAANLLPIPGAAVVRMQGLRKGGARVSHALNATAVIGLGWLGMTAVIAGAVEVTARPWFTLAFVGSGVALLIGAWLLVARSRGAIYATRTLGRLAAIETGFVLVSGLKLFLTAHALHLHCSPAQGISLTSAAVVASAAGLLPGGLGLREALAAALAPAIGMPAAVGLVITAIDRIVSLVALAILATVVIGLDRWRLARLNVAGGTDQEIDAPRTTQEPVG